MKEPTRWHEFTDEDHILAGWFMLHVFGGFPRIGTPGYLLPPHNKNHMIHLWGWEPKTDAERVAYFVMRKMIHMSPGLNMGMAVDRLVERIDKVKQDAYKQGQEDAIKLLQDNL